MIKPLTSVITVAVTGLVLTLAGCASNPQGAIFDTGSALEVRSYQTRVLQTGDKEVALRAVIATLQDLGFLLDRADATLGVVTATKLQGYQVRMTVTVRPRSPDAVMVRANADYSEPLIGKTAVPIEDPATYQDFFQALERSAFLAALRAE